MGTGLVVYENNQQIEISVDDLRKYVAPGLDEKEFWMFVQTAKTYGLNPIKREIYAVKYGNTFSVITGYQVYLQRLISADILEYWDVKIEKPDLKNMDTWIGVFTAKRKDWTKEFVWEVAMKEVNKKQALWNLQPEFQLKKVAISQGCRMIAPEIVGGMPYIADEIGIDETNQYEQKPAEKPAEKPKETNGDEKQKAIDAVKAKIDSFLTVTELTTWEAKEEKAILKSKIKAEIEEMIKSKRHDLTVETLGKLTTYDPQIIVGYLNTNPEQTAINDCVRGDAEAIKEVTVYLANYKASIDSQADGEISDEEAELDAMADTRASEA